MIDSYDRNRQRWCCHRSKRGYKQPPEQLPVRFKNGLTLFYGAKPDKYLIGRNKPLPFVDLELLSLWVVLYYQHVMRRRIDCFGLYP